MKKVLSFISSALILSLSLPYIQVSAEETQTIIEFGRSKIGSTEYNNYCQRFIRHCYESAGLYSQQGASSAIEAYELWGNDDIEAEIPIGACLYFDTSEYGHVAIYTGNNQMIHGVKIVKEEQISDYYWEKFLGWGYQGGIEPKGIVYESEIETAYPSVPSLGYISSKENDVYLHWESQGENTSYYELNIYNADKGGEIIFNQVYTDNFGELSLELPPANYYAVIKAVNENDNSVSYSYYQNFYTWNPMIGDLNHNGTIEISDMVALGKYLMNLSEIDEETLPLCDLSNDGIVNMLDYMTFKQYFVKSSQF